MGQGYVEIASLKVGELSYFDGPTPFDWALIGEPSLKKIRVYAKDSETLVETCFAHASASGPVVACDVTRPQENQ